MSLTGHRVEGYRVELMNKQEQSRGNLSGVLGGSLSWNANATLPASGVLSVQDLQQEIDFSKDRVKIWWQVDGYGEWPLGVYVLAAPSQDYDDTGISRELVLIDKLTVVSDDRLRETLQFPAGANIIESARDVLLSTGETRISVTESTSTLSNAVAWSPGTSKLQVINDLLSSAGYWGLWSDREGQFRIEPYVQPAVRPVVWSFEEGHTSLHLPEWSYELPLWEASNMVVFISQADDAGNFWTAYAEDDNPDSPTSTVSMGRVLNPIVEENVEASSQADLQKQADRKLLDNSNAVGRLTVSHAAVPVWYNEAVFFQSQGMETRATVVKMDMPLTPGALVSAEWRQA